ncbi:hypothetical protein JR311_20430 (plasmid) [Bacillus velezensis]|uniref:hypothetical protein n=1 Tax=Bacillus velezensis TaxID=492670 RepID=UPI001959EA1E|nr:hypothetical protein [Bacillus velezensis]QRV11391.1 hypothetical protein JR311_20430 [Bacillus velezensis]
MSKSLAEKILFEGEADEYASIIENNQISHDDCIEILKAVAKLKGTGLSNKILIDRLTRSQ